MFTDGIGEGLDIGRFVVVGNWGSNGTGSTVLELGVCVDGLGDTRASECICVVVCTCTSEGDGTVSDCGVGDHPSGNGVAVSMGVSVGVPGTAIGIVHMVINSASYVAVWTTLQFSIGGIAFGHRYRYRLTIDQSNKHCIVANVKWSLSTMCRVNQ